MRASGYRNYGDQRIRFFYQWEAPIENSCDSDSGAALKVGRKHVRRGEAAKKREDDSRVFYCNESADHEECFVDSVGNNCLAGIVSGNKAPSTEGIGGEV